MEGTNRGAYYVQPGSNCGFGANSQGQALTAHADMEKVDEKSKKKDFLSGFLNIWYPIPSTNCFVRGKGEVTTDLPVKIMSYSMGIKQGNQ